MHEEEARLVVEHVIVNRRHLDAVRLASARTTGLTSSAVSTKSPGDGRLAGSGRLEVDGDRRSHGLRHVHAAVLRHLSPWNVHLIDAAIDLALAAKRLIDGVRVEVDRLAGRRGRRACVAALAEMPAVSAPNGVLLAPSASRRVVASFVGAPWPCTCMYIVAGDARSR